jgi:hypothetical protein
VCLGAVDFLKTNLRALVGNSLLHDSDGCSILKYDLAKHHLSVIDPPESYGILIVPSEDNLLGVAGAGILRHFSHGNLQSIKLKLCSD